MVKYIGFSHVNSCGEMASGVKSKIVLNSSCAVDSDCTKLRLSCPFDCDVPVNNAATKEILDSVNGYNRSCMMLCPDCPKGFETVAAKCLSGVCSLGNSL